MKPSTAGAGSEYDEEPGTYYAQGSGFSPASSGTDDCYGNPPGGDGVHMQFACHACKLSKVKCDKRHPCSRCQRLDLQCVAQNRSRGRPLKLHKIKSAPPRLDSSGPSEGGSSGPPPVASGSGRGGGEGSDRMAVDGEGRRPTEDGGAWMRGSRGPAAAPAAGSGRSSPPAYEAPSWSRNSHIYDVVAQAYLSHFTTLLNQGRLDHKRALCIVKTWMMYHHKHNVDLTRGISDAMLSHLGSFALGSSLFNTPQDPNHDDDETLHDPSGNYFDVRLIPSYISQLDDGISPFCGYIYQAGDFHVFSNARFAETFMDAEEVKSHMMSAKVLPCFVWACFIVHSDDVRDMIMHLTDTFFTRPERSKELVHICRCHDRTGAVFMGLIRARWIVLNDGDYASLALNIIRLPASPFLRPLQTGGSAQLAATAPPRQQQQQQAPPSPQLRRSPEGSQSSTPSSSSTNSPRLPYASASSTSAEPAALPPPRRPPPPPSTTNKPPLPPSHPSWAPPQPLHAGHPHMRRGPPPPPGSYPGLHHSSDPDEAPPPPSLTGWDSLDQIAGLEQQNMHEGEHAGDPVETYYALCNLVKEAWPNHNHQQGHHHHHNGSNGGGGNVVNPSQPAGAANGGPPQPSQHMQHVMAVTAGAAAARLHHQQQQHQQQQQQQLL